MGLFWPAMATFLTQVQVNLRRGIEPRKGDRILWELLPQMVPSPFQPWHTTLHAPVSILFPSPHILPNSFSGEGGGGANLGKGGQFKVRRVENMIHHIWIHHILTHLALKALHGATQFSISNWADQDPGSPTGQAGAHHELRGHMFSSCKDSSDCLSAHAGYSGSHLVATVSQHGQTR